MNRFFRAKTDWGYGVVTNLIEHLKEEGVCPESKVLTERLVILKAAFDPSSNGYKVGKNYREELLEFWQRYQAHPERALAEE